MLALFLGVLLHAHWASIAPLTKGPTRRNLCYDADALQLDSCERSRPASREFTVLVMSARPNTPSVWSLPKRVRTMYEP